MTGRGPAVVGEIYAAFGRGDVEHILALMTDDVVAEHWDLPPTTQQRGVPWLVERTGKQSIAEFFGIVSTFEFTRFEPKLVFGDDHHVAAVVATEWKHPDGTALAEEEIHLWTLDDDGKVTAMRHHVDTSQHLAAAGLVPSMVR